MTTAPQLLGEARACTVLGDAYLVHSHEATALVVPGSGRVVAAVGFDDVVWSTPRTRSVASCVRCSGSPVWLSRRR